jgi:hypothetical protein
MRIAYKDNFKGDIVYEIIEVDQDVMFNFKENFIRFWKKNRNTDNITICQEYIVKDIEKLYNQMLKDGFIDLTMYEPFNEFQQCSCATTFHTIKQGKRAKKVLDYENEDEDGINMHIKSLKQQLAEWEQMRDNLNKAEE